MDDLFQGPSIRPGDYHPLRSLGGIKGLVLHTDDIVAAHKSLSDRGVLLSEIKTEPWGLFATFEDPDGNGWLLRQVREERAQRQVRHEARDHFGFAHGRAADPR
jgi:hypothetical protein